MTRKRKILVIGEQVRVILANNYYEYKDIKRLISTMLARLNMCEKPHLIIREIYDKGFLSRTVIDGKTFWRARYD